ncbi:MAG: putative AraC family transcriptional regulator [Moraxellaceae bacterium]|jgi:AraC-like DNA-binding protein|nr:putative AraC family transcriptional regulator [Moraxellaceae bacterium]
MPIPSPWPLNPESRRWLVPPAACRELARHPLSRELYLEALGFYRHAAGHAMQRDAAEHEDHLLLYCVQGQGEAGWGDTVESVGPGTLVLLPAGVAHHYQASAEQPWSLYWAHFAGPAAADFMAPLLAGQPAAACPLGLGLVADFQALLAQAREGAVLPSLLHVASLLRALLTHAQVLAPRGAARHGRGRPGRFDAWAVQAYMQAHLDESLTLDQLAAAFGFERFHFAKTYRRLTGRAPLTHFLQLRMERAARLLDSGEVRVGEVARVLGYEDAHYFSRQFRRMMGVAPSEYRGLKRG